MRGRAAYALAAMLLAFGALGGCDRGEQLSEGTGEFPEQVPSVIGVRADGDRLELWTGTRCREVREIRLVLDPGAEDPRATVEYVAPRPRTIQSFWLGKPPAGFWAREPLPASASWQEAESLLVVLSLADGERSVTVDLAPVSARADGAGFGPRQYVVGDQVLTRERMLAGDGGDYALVCSPDPTQEG